MGMHRLSKCLILILSVYFYVFGTSALKGMQLSDVVVCFNRLPVDVQKIIILFTGCDKDTEQIHTNLKALALVSKLNNTIINDSSLTKKMLDFIAANNYIDLIDAAVIIGSPAAMCFIASIKGCSCNTSPLEVDSMLPDKANNNCYKLVRQHIEQVKSKVITSRLITRGIAKTDVEITSLLASCIDCSCNYLSNISDSADITGIVLIMLGAKQAHAVCGEKMPLRKQSIFKALKPIAFYSSLYRGLTCAISDGSMLELMIALKSLNIYAKEATKRNDDEIVTRIKNIGETALYKAAMLNKCDSVLTLLEHNIDVNTNTDNEGKTALLQAAMRGYVSIAKILLEHKADPNIEDCEFGYTPLMWAAHRGFADIVTLLLTYNAYVRKQDYEGNTALHWAAYNGHVSTVKLLLDHSGMKHMTNKNSQTALDIARQRNHTDIIKMLS